MADVTMTHLSDTGRARAQNEDSVACVADPTGARGCLLVVADGMGGAEAGEDASRIAVETVRELYFASGAAPAVSLAEAVQEANHRIQQASLEPQKHGMGTTCSALALLDGHAAVAHVGDSRVYRYHRGVLRRITRVHSIWAEAVIRDGISPAVRSGQNVLTRALGVEGVIDIDVHDDIRVDFGDRFLLCSDGLWGQVTDPEIAWALENLEPAEVCRHLVDLANDRGGPDNVSVAVAAIAALDDVDLAAEE
jgi:protein phosphatase